LLLFEWLIGTGQKRRVDERPLPNSLQKGDQPKRRVVKLRFIARTNQSLTSSHDTKGLLNPFFGFRGTPGTEQQRGFETIANVELLHNLRHIAFDGVVFQSKLLGYFLVRKA
jgi:hypothetical protein